MIFVAIRGDGQHRVAVGERAPQRALGAPKAPPGLVHVHGRREADLLEQVGVGLGERVTRALKDRLDAAAADPRGEQLLAQLDRVAARDALRTDTVATAPCSLGPNALWATSAGSAAVWRCPQSGQHTR